MPSAIKNLLKENDKRNAKLYATFNPVTGEGSILERSHVTITDFPITEQWLPKEMLKEPFVKQLVKAGSVCAFYDTLGEEIELGENEYDYIVKTFVRIRCLYDFPFWAVMYVLISNKLGGEDIHFSLNSPQRILISELEKMRIANKPIRLILLKARQWGGSTATQMYMAWLQLVHKEGLNSLIVGHVKDASYEVRDMFDKMINEYPVELLHDLGENYDPNEPKIIGVGNSGNIRRIPQRNCKIKIGSYEKPESARGGAYSLVHCTEVGLWSPTDNKSPEKVVRSACSGITLKPLTMIVYESTANGTGNFFEREYNAAKESDEHIRRGEESTSQFRSLFIAWFQIELYRKEFESEKEKIAFAMALEINKNDAYSPTNRAEPGRYLWYLWERGASLEAIAWYIDERKKYTDHGDMASEYPTDDMEAFVYSGCKVFDKILVEAFRPACREPRYVGDVYADGTEGKQALQHVRFAEDKTGLLCVWDKPEIDPMEKIKNRYLVVVDIGGRSVKADWSVICVFDRMYLMNGERPEVVAQWYGHIDMDLLAWKAAQIAKWYDDALLVIESNTLETKDKERMVDGDQSQFILYKIKDVYDNLYAREQNEDEIRAGAPKRYGFHTNVSTKPMIIANLIKMVREHSYTERDGRCLDEYLTYEQKQNGAYGAIAGKHDDLLMTRAIGLHIAYNFKVMPIPVITSRSGNGFNKSRNRVSKLTEAVIT